MTGEIVREKGDGVRIFSNPTPKIDECERGFHSLSHDREADEIRCRDCGKTWVRKS